MFSHKIGKNVKKSIPTVNKITVPTFANSVIKHNMSKQTTRESRSLLGVYEDSKNNVQGLDTILAQESSICEDA